MADLVTRLVKNKDGSYMIIGRYSDGTGWGNGLGCWKLDSIEVDNHYILRKEDLTEGGLVSPFRVIGADKKSEIDKILYGEAKRLGEIRAERDGNHLLEIISA